MRRLPVPACARRRWLAPLCGSVLLLCGTAAARAQAPPPPPGPLGPPPVPTGNPLTAAKANLGKVLFWDEQLSSTRTVACGTCHRAPAGGSDPRSAAPMRAVDPGSDAIFGTADDVAGSPGVPANEADGSYVPSVAFGLRPQVTTRRARSTIDAAYAPELFGDGRAGGELLDPLTGDPVLAAGAALETQSLEPPVSGREMAHLIRDWDDVAERVATSRPLALTPAVPGPLLSWIGGRTYPQLFAEAFGSPEVTPVRIVEAIASHERTLVANRTPWDAAVAGGAPLTALEQQGQALFGSVGCAGCHRGSRFTDDAYHYLGVRPVGEDAGRFAVTGNAGDQGAFRTPDLRNVVLRGPYMHDGRFATLAEVVDFYDRGGDFDAPNKSPAIHPLGLTAGEKAALVAFLERPLTDPRVAQGVAPFDAPALYSASDRVPVIEGSGLPGAGGQMPQPVALEPPLAGNPGFTLAVWGERAGADALLAVDTIAPGLTPPGAASFAWRWITLADGGSIGGYGSVSLSIPDDPALYGERLFARWYVADAQAAGGYAVSRLVRFTVFAPGATDGALFADGYESGDASAWSTAVGAP